MNSSPANPKARLAIALAACAVLAAGAAGLVLLSSHTSGEARKTGSMLLAPMIGVIDPCVAAQADSTPPGMEDLARSCTQPEGSAAALVESTLSALQPHGSAAGP